MAGTSENPPTTEAAVHELVEELRAERDRLLDRSEEFEESRRDLVSRQAEALDSADRARIERDDERLDPLAEQAARRADDLTRLIERAAQGRAAICDDCGGPIPLARLRAVPGTTRCIECEQVAEEAAEEAG